MTQNTIEPRTSGVAPELEGIMVARGYPLSRLTTFGIGGPADWVAFCRTVDEIVSTLQFCKNNGIDYFLLGDGSNVLASDKGFRGMIIVNQIDHLEINGEEVYCGAGFSLHKAVESSTAVGLSGWESMAGIAGTIGGAIVGNAGAYGQSISDTLISVDLYHAGLGRHTEVKENLGFRYRHSNLKGSGKVVLSGRFRLRPADRQVLRERVEAILNERWKRHPRENISAGCFFKNVESEGAPHGKIAAGYLLDQVGAKQMAVGNAGVYSGHANILINRGGAHAEEVRELALTLKRKVKESFGIELTEEVVLLGDFS